MAADGVLPPTKFVVRVWIERMKDDKYLVVGEATDMAQMVKTLKTEPCDPCTLADARTRAYQFAAMLVKQVAMRGGEVEILDVSVEEPRAPRKHP